jgi:hypothetical protein
MSGHDWEGGGGGATDRAPPEVVSGFLLHSCTEVESSARAKAYTRYAAWSYKQGLMLTEVLRSTGGDREQVRECVGDGQKSLVGDVSYYCAYHGLERGW